MRFDLRKASLNVIHRERRHPWRLCRSQRAFLRFQHAPLTTNYQSQPISQIVAFSDLNPTDK
jgi:hypothetical protein